LPVTFWSASDATGAKRKQKIAMTSAKQYQQGLELQAKYNNYARASRVMLAGKLSSSRSVSFFIFVHIGHPYIRTATGNFYL
jgi:hypothetical protein